MSQDRSAVSVATTSGFRAAQSAFLLAVATYFVVWAAVLIFVSWVFGWGSAIVLSLILAFPFAIALRMYWRWQAVRGRELGLLLVLLVFVLGGSIFTVWHWYDTGLHHQQARDVRFEELTRMIHADSAFRDIECSINNHNKCRYWISGTVASQADIEHLKSLGTQYDVFPYMEDIEVADSPEQANDK